MAAQSDIYTHGHHESVLRSHRWRTAENSAAYLIGDLRPGTDVLDVGCGPGTITVDFAGLVAPGTVTGIDNVPAPLDIARTNAEQAGQGNVTFAQADVYSLPYEDDSFDVVHTHQTLQHLTEPVAALSEMRRVCKPGGLVAAREVDFGGMEWFPRSRGMDAWLELYYSVARANNGEPDGGRSLKYWARQAGLHDITCTTSSWCFATDEERGWWGGLWADRVRQSSFAEQAKEYGLATREDLDQVAAAWREWIDSPDGWFAVLHGEIRCLL